MDHKKELLRLFDQLKPVDETPNCVRNLIAGKRIILYGAGDGLATFVSFILSRYQLSVDIVLDKKFKKNDIYLNIPVYSPHDFKPTKEQQENAIVIITVTKVEYQKEILSTLQMMGFKNIIFVTDIYEFHLPFVSEDHQEKTVSYYMNNKKLIFKSLKLFNDIESKDVFICFMKTHMQRIPVCIPNHPITEQYLPKDIYLNRGKSRVINCGSYNGDTVIKLNNTEPIEALACFEPDLDNFKLLHENIEANCKNLTSNIIFYPCGIYSKEIQFRFSSGNKISSMISHDGESIIQCVSLDNVIPHFNPTFINMDIEGAEYEAIKGAEKMIRESRPDLAICVYHSPAHIWEIPLFIASLNLGYGFYLRNYSSFTTDTVLYATVSKEIK